MLYKCSQPNNYWVVGLSLSISLISFPLCKETLAHQTSKAAFTESDLPQKSNPHPKPHSVTASPSNINNRFRCCLLLLSSPSIQRPVNHWVNDSRFQYSALNVVAEAILLLIMPLRDPILRFQPLPLVSWYIHLASLSWTSCYCIK